MNEWWESGWKRALEPIQRVLGLKKDRVSWCQINRRALPVVKCFQVPLLPSRSPIHCIGKSKQEIPANVNAIYTGNSVYRQIPRLWHGWISELGFFVCLFFCFWMFNVPKLQGWNHILSAKLTDPRLWFYSANLWAEPLLESMQA